MSTSPICRCRVLYLGSSVPHITKDGLQGIQEPLRELYPEQGPLGARGIDSWLSVWSNGLLLENVDESRRQVTRFFPVETLHYCAAVRYVVVPGGGPEGVEKFLPLDSPFGHRTGATSGHPPLFACILRRTEGIKVLECHAFICKKEAAANALVRCCFHAYADNTYAKQLEENPYYLDGRRSRSMSGLNTLEMVEEWRRDHDERSEFMTNGSEMPTESTIHDDNYKVWTGRPQIEKEAIYSDVGGTLRSNQSTTAKPRPRQMMLPSRPPPPLPAIPDATKLKPPPKPSKPKMEPIPPPKTNGHHKAMSSIGRPPTRQGQIYVGSGLYTERRQRAPERALLAAEEPLYMPSVRPTSPVSTYQPSVFPHEQYYIQYGTAPRSVNRAPRRRKQRIGQETLSEPSHSEADSPFNTGIYRKKGHLNERAFSYSIRQEHTSRSNSLANLHFYANGDSGPHPQQPHQAEITRMMAGVDLGRHVTNGHTGKKKHPNHRK